MSRMTGLMLAAVLVLACGVVYAQDKKGGGGTMGTIKAVDGDKLTITVQARGPKGGGDAPAPAPTEKVVTIDASTKILKQTSEMEPAVEGKRPTPKTVEATKADLTVGKRVAVTAEGDKATQITLLADRAAGGGKDKGKKGDKGNKGGDAK